MLSSHPLPLHAAVYIEGESPTAPATGQVLAFCRIGITSSEGMADYSRVRSNDAIAENRIVTGSKLFGSNSIQSGPVRRTRPV